MALLLAKMLRNLRMKHLLACLYLCSACAPVYAQTAHKVQLVAVGFRIKNAGLWVSGQFGGAQASMVFGPQHLAHSQINASLPANNIDTGIALRDKHLRGPDYFDAGKFPSLLLQTRSIAQTGEGTYKAACLLTIKGMGKTIEVPFSYTETGRRAQFKGQFALNRLDFGVGKSHWLMADSVQVFFTVNTSL